MYSNIYYMGETMPTSLEQVDSSASGRRIYSNILCVCLDKPLSYNL